VKVASVLFAAGSGTRLRPLTARVPKPALPVLDVPLAAGGLAGLARDVPPVVVNVSHLGVAVWDALAPWSQSDEVSFLWEKPEPYGTAGTLRALADRLDARVVTRNADALIDLEPSALVAAHDRLGAPATVAAAPVDAGADLRIAGERALELIDRRADPQRPGWLFLGMAVFERSVVGLVSDARPSGLTETLLRPLVARGDLAVHVHAGYALDVGTPARYLRASLDVLQGAAPEPVAHPGTRVSAGAGSAYVGPGASAPRDALGPGAVLLRGARAEAGSRIESSIVWPGERVRAGTRLVGSIRALGRTLPAATGSTAR